MSYIEIKNIVFSYQKNEKVLDDVSLNIEKGEHICILGHNGSGKSTLAKLMVGLLVPNSGSIYIDGVKLTEETVDELRKQIGIVFQNPDNQFVGVTVRDDIAFGLENRQVPKQEMEELIDKYSHLVSMENFLDNNPEDLSGGEKQRVAIAGVLAMNPEVIIFDEATSMLDPKGVREVMNVVKNLKDKTIISITHNLEEALLASRVIVLNEGKIVLTGTPQEVFKEKEILKNSKLDILESMKLLEIIEKSNLKNKEKIEEALWELSYTK
ncbi:MAG TPA: energy-coupling factor transporter ATPase [Acholeplasmataceae bacterium]|jgi:energy-coupling factor transport system ATP-binding protein|nr:energy-coupling factor transporter ATPase [Acholeplasmataceae bacterium]